MVIEIKITEEERQRRIKEIKDIETLMNDTYNKCLALGISLSVNTNNGRMEWRKNSKGRK